MSNALAPLFIVADDLAKIRKVVKAAGLTPARIDSAARAGISGYSRVSLQGFKLRHETDYRMKQHVRTGRVVLDLMLSSWNRDEDKASADLQAARKALLAAGFDVV